MKFSVLASIRAILVKECRYALRDKADTLTMLLFSLTVLASVSMTLGGARLEANVNAALLWVILFLAMVTSIGEVFRTEALTKTLALLRLYGTSQAILFGKMLFVLLELSVLAIFITLMYLPLFNISLSLSSFLLLMLIILVGLSGFAGTGTFVAALAASTSGRNGSLFAGLLLPLILPLILPAITLTASVLTSSDTTLSLGINEGAYHNFANFDALASFPWPSLWGMLAYDGAIIAGASILFDYIWVEGL